VDGKVIALEISVNGKRLYTIGADDPGFVDASVIRERKRDAPRIQIGLSAHGANLPVDGEVEYLDWNGSSLKVGDEVTIRVVDTDAIDAPHQRRIHDAKRNEKRKREHYESLKREFGE
jgi:hypothetical protein